MLHINTMMTQDFEDVWMELPNMGNKLSYAEGQWMDGLQQV